MLIVRGIMWISVLIVMLICMVKTKRNGMKKKIRALIFVVFLFILFVFMQKHFVEGIAGAVKS